MTTTDRLKTLLDARHEAGLAKYGTTVDRTDITPDQWAQHALEELLDGAAYLMRLREEMEKREECIQALIEAARVADARELLEWVETMTARILEMEEAVNELPRWKRYGEQADKRIAALEAHVARLEKAGDACAQESWPHAFASDETRARKLAAFDRWTKAKEAKP